ncbi:MAG: methyltransferase type 11 [Candidatus Marinimicrobia bacterium]|nr:methyltransferase type 11 [Candidatus Neomarinimicrobiota bacterium]|tara:strand:+ start:185 stop:868 length:684 start_codon:yes stop_codon:yes gene_type:complete
MKQKNIFLNTEGNKWYERNRSSLNKRNYDKDLIVNEIIKINDFIGSKPNQLKPKSKKGRILEVGCGNAERLSYIQKKLDYDCYGIEPSLKAVENGRKLGLDICHGTADELPFKENYFDIIIYGFCLYLCDREDLFKIAYEADRTLNRKGFIIILDFFSEHKTIIKPYKHKSGVFTHKMDYSKMFTWNPYYTIFRNQILHHDNKQISDEKHEWISIFTIRKNDTLNAK